MFHAAALLSNGLRNPRLELLSPLPVANRIVREDDLRATICCPCINDSRRRVKSPPSSFRGMSFDESFAGNPLHVLLICWRLWALLATGQRRAP